MYNLHRFPLKSSDSQRIGFFDHILKTGSRVRVTVTGGSMSPFIRGGEVVILKRKPISSLVPGDVIFLRTAGRQLLLHRIIRIQKAETQIVSIQTQGDANGKPDYPVVPGQVLGRVCIVEKTARFWTFQSIHTDHFFWRVFGKLMVWAARLKSSRHYPIFRPFFPPAIRSLYRSLRARAFQ